MFSQKAFTLIEESRISHFVPSNIDSIIEYKYERNNGRANPDTLVVIENDTIELDLYQKNITTYPFPNKEHKIRIWPNGEIFDTTNVEYSYSGKILSHVKFENGRKIIYKYDYDRKDRLITITQELIPAGKNAVEIVGQLNCEYVAETSFVQSVSSTMGFSKKYELTSLGDTIFYRLNEEFSNAFFEQEFGRKFSLPKQNIYMTADSLGGKTYHEVTLSQGDFGKSFDYVTQYNQAGKPVYKKEVNSNNQATIEKFEYDVNGELIKKTYIKEDTTEEEVRFYNTYDYHGSLVKRLDSNYRDISFKIIKYKEE